MVYKFERNRRKRLNNLIKLGVSSLILFIGIIGVFALSSLKVSANKINNDNIVLSQKVATTSIFKDVEKDHYAYDAIVWAEEHGIVSGYTDKNGKRNGYFGPNNTVTEQQFTKMLATFYSLEDKGNLQKNSFPKVWSDEYYDALSAYGVPLNGYFDNDLRAKEVKRGVVAQALGYIAGGKVTLEASINYLIANDISSGQNVQYQNTDLKKYFGSDNTLTRAQAVVFLYRLFEKNMMQVSLLAEETKKKSSYFTLFENANSGLIQLDPTLRTGNQLNVSVSKVDGSIVTTYGDSPIKYIGGGTQGTDVEEVLKIREEIDNKKKEIRPAYEILINNLESRFSYQSDTSSVNVYEKSTKKSIFTYFENNSSSLCKKGEYCYFDEAVFVTFDFYEESSRNKESILSMLKDVGFNFTSEELEKVMKETRQLDGLSWDFPTIRNYTFNNVDHTFADIMYRK